MAITRSFGGQTLLKPGAYSVSRVDNAQGIAVGENNTLMLIGEASDGIPGAIENSQTFTNVQNLVDYYVSGDIVDAALAASRPSLTPGVSAPTNFIIYKTNPSLFANFTASFLAGTTPAADYTVSSVVIFPINASGETFTETIVTTIPLASTAIQAADLVEANVRANANVDSVFNVIDEAGDLLINIVAKKAGPQFGPLIAVTNPDGKASIIHTSSDTSAMTITNSPATETLADGSGVTGAITANALAGIGQTSEVSLAAAFTDAFNPNPNVIIPLWSNPASTLNMTDQFGIARPADGIDYIKAAAALQSHLITRSSVAVRKECQGFIGARDADWRTTITTLDGASISSFLVQACIQDVRVVNSLGALQWHGPHIMCAILAGIRLGSTVGEPLTFKTINANGVGHNIDPSTSLPNAAATQFRPGFDFNDAINAGLTFTENAAGGNRVVVDNTRYAIDESFVFNRGSVIEAAQFVARTSRDLLERVFVGQKVSNGAALSIKNLLRNYLIQLNTDNIITSSSDAPFGFVEDTFTVTINGNTAAIQVEVKPVQGLDFIFIDFTLGNITQSA